MLQAGDGYAFTDGNDSTGWQLRKDKDGIQVYTREHEENGLLEYRAITLIKTDMDQLVEMIYEVEKYPDWTPNCDSATVYEVINDSTWIEYMTSPVPWPISDRDVVMEFSIIINTEDYFEARLRSVPDAVPERKHYVRMKESSGYWIFKRKDSDNIEVIHQFFGNPEGNIPNWIVNMFIVSGPFKTLENLKSRCESP